jgi:hypothetical protein
MTTSLSNLYDPSECDCEKFGGIILGSKALLKACHDSPFDYALKLRTGEVIRFCGATIINAEWIHLEVYAMDEQPERNCLPFPADRGIDVRIGDIVWVMDAPEGS